ncbi:MAG: sulfite exporter TauE/SafE family protein, partial [Caldimonas sp.]
PVTGRFVWSWRTATLLSAIGALTGFMTGLLGVGGGFVIVPMLRRFTAVSMHGIVATSLLVIALVGSGGVVASVIRGATVPVGLTLWFTGATACGMVAGRLASHRLSERFVQAGFALVVLIVGVGLLLKATLNF